MQRRHFLGAVAASFASAYNLKADSRTTPFLRDLKSEIISYCRSKYGKSSSLTILFPKGALGSLKPTGASFEENTGIKIRFVEGSLNEINTRILLETMIGADNYDVALPPTFSIPDLVDAGALEDLSPYVAKFEPPTFAQGMLYTLGSYYQGKFYGYQTDGDVYMMFFNQGMVADEHMKKLYEDTFGHPWQVPNTWEMLDRQIRFFHQPKRNRFGGSLFRIPQYLPWEWWLRFHAKGGMPFSDNMTPLIQTEAGVHALEELIALGPFLEPGVLTHSLPENWQSFAQGNKYCNIGWGGSQKYFHQVDKETRNNLVFAPPPAGDRTPKGFSLPYFNWGWNYIVNPNSRKKEEAYLYTLYACLPSVSTMAIREPSGFLDPFHEDHYHDPEIRRMYGDTFLKSHHACMKACLPDLYIKGHQEYFAVLKEFLTQALTAKLSPKAALSQAAKQWQNITLKHGLKQQLKQWLYLKTLYPQL